MAFYRTLEERSTGGRFLAAYDPVAYSSILNQIEQRKKFYEQNKTGNELEHHRKRLERLEALADALFQHLRRTPNGTIRFPLAKLQAGVNGKSVKNDVHAVFSAIKIEERNSKGIATYHFLVVYQTEGRIEYGYIIPRVKC